jgi:hypothetical protein
MSLSGIQVLRVNTPVQANSTNLNEEKPPERHPKLKPEKSGSFGMLH